MSDWCILRTAGRSTLPLAQSLGADGYDVWTPVETTTRRVPRMNAKRTIRLPIMAGFVFARARHLVDLMQLADMNGRNLVRKAAMHTPRNLKIGDVEHFSPAELSLILAAKAHAHFSVLRDSERIHLVAERHLDALRILEAKRTPIKRAEYSFPRNRSVRVKGGIFGGMVGAVVRSTPTTTLILFDGAHKVEIPTSHLELDAVEESQPPMLRAA